MCQQDLRSRVTHGSPFHATDNTPPTKRQISWSELARHNTTKDAWIAIKGRVYDVTQFAPKHPGGDILFTAAGSDATDVFAGFHASTDAWRLLPDLCVGLIDTPTSPLLANVDEEYVRDILNMRKQVYALNLYDSSKLFYAAKISSNLLICGLSVALALNVHTWTSMLVSAFIMGLFWQQCGWLAHDFLHHQVFLHRRLNNMFGLMIGNLFQGFSVSWWKNKHNHHHAVPNVTDAPGGGDPDIATTPILFWSEKIVEGEDLECLPRWMLRNQGVLYFPILCMARMSWLLQSLQYQLAIPNRHVTSFPLYYAELCGLAAHHALFAWLVVRIAMVSSVGKAIVFAACAQAFGGVLLGVVFAVGHNAMDILTEKEMRTVDFIRLQVRTTRNVTPSWFSNWFTGGLNYQIEHHIFPTVPRHHLPALAKLLQQFCLKHSIPYASETLLEGNKAVCQILRTVSKIA